MFLDVQNRNTYNQNYIFYVTNKLKVSWWSCSALLGNQNHILQTRNSVLYSWFYQSMSCILSTSMQTIHCFQNLLLPLIEPVTNMFANIVVFRDHCTHFCAYLVDWCRNRMRILGKPTATISNNWSKSTAVAFCISVAASKSFFQSATIPKDSYQHFVLKA
jgi:hypothetical protein